MNDNVNLITTIIVEIRMIVEYNLITQIIGRFLSSSSWYIREKKSSDIIIKQKTLIHCSSLWCILSLVGCSWLYVSILRVCCTSLRVSSGEFRWFNIEHIVLKVNDVIKPPSRTCCHWDDLKYRRNWKLAPCQWQKDSWQQLLRRRRPPVDYCCCCKLPQLVAVLTWQCRCE